MDWQPIESAPKDGTPILAYGRYAWGGDWHLPDFSRGDLGHAVIRYVEKETWLRLPDGGFPGGEPTGIGVWELIHDNPYVDWMEPTHWIPLPSPPVVTPAKVEAGVERAGQGRCS